MPSNPGAAIYGTVTIGAILATETAQRETYAETVGAVLIALLLYWLAHSYAEFASWRLQVRKPLGVAGLARTMVRELPIIYGAAIPVAALLLRWAIGARLTSAVTAGIWTAVATIVMIEIVAGVRAKQSGRELVFQAMFGTFLGLLVIALRLVLH